LRKVTLVMLVLMFVIPWTNAFAASTKVDVLKGVAFNALNGSVSGIANITDDNDSTRATWNTNATLEYRFPNPVDLLDGSYITTSAALGTAFVLYDAADKEIYRRSVTAGTFYIPALLNVAKVRIIGEYVGGFGGSAVSSLRLYSFPTNPKDTNLILGKGLVITNSPDFPTGTIANEFTNGKTNDSPVFRAQGTRYNYTFPKPVYFSYVKFYTPVKIGAVLIGPDGGVLASSTTIGGTSPQILSFDLDNVAKVYFFNPNTNAVVSEIEAYGRASEFNPDSSLFVIKGLKYDFVGLNKDFQLSWEPISSPYFEEYRVYQNGNLLKAGKNNYAIITNQQPGEKNTFKVSSVDIYGKEYPAATLTYTVPLPDSTPPSVPKLSGSAGNGIANLEWTPSPEDDLAGYTIYQDGKTTRKVGQGNKAAIDGLTNGKTYRFSVTAFDTSGNESARSNEVELAPKSVITETEQETGPDYLLVKWTKTEGATGYRIYLNGRLIGSVGPTVFEYKITRAMGYIPGAISNKAEARAILADGSEGGSNNPTAPVLELADGYGVGDAFKAGIEFVKLLNGWVLIALAIILANMIIGFLYLLNKKYKITQRG